MSQFRKSSEDFRNLLPFFPLLIGSSKSFSGGGGVIAFFVGGGGGSSMSGVKEEKSPDFRSPEVGISA